jgi:hypothetical protein
MGSKLAKSPTDNVNSINNESSQANTSQNPQKTATAHPHGNLNTANIPAGCPMHQAKTDANSDDQTKNLVKTASGSGCPIGNNNDINPNNMV